MNSAASAAYLHFSRILAPYFQNKKGSGTQRRERKAGIEAAQFSPRFSYMYLCIVSFDGLVYRNSDEIAYVVKSGNAKPKRERRMAFAASTEAAKMV